MKQWIHSKGNFALSSLIFFNFILFSSHSVFAQISYTQDWEDGTAGLADWVNDAGSGGSFSRFTGATVCGAVGGSVRANQWSPGHVRPFRSPLLGTSNGMSINVTFDYKVAVWSANTVGSSGTDFTIEVQWANNTTGPWTTIGTINNTNHVVSGLCAAAPGTYSFSPPANDQVYIRFLCTRLGGDYYVNFDNISVQQQALPVAQVGNGVTATANTSHVPIYRFSAASSNRYNRSMAIYTQAELAAAGITPGSSITKLAFQKGVGGTVAGKPFALEMWMGTSAVNPPLASTSWNDVTSGKTQVYSNTALEIADVAGYVEFDLSTPFVYFGGTLEVAFQNSNAFTSPYSTNKFEWIYDNTLGTGYVIGAPSSSASFSSSNLTVSSLYSQRPNTQLTYIPGANCTGITAPGLTQSTLPNACASPFTLSVENPSAGVGIVYQWESSTDNITWNPIVGADASTYIATQSAATYYRAKVKCTPSNDSAYSTPLLVGQNNFLACYCTPAPTNGGGGDNITEVVLNSFIRNTSALGNVPPYYSIHNDDTIQLQQLGFNNMSVSVGSDGSQFVRVWVDYNHNGIFEASESVGHNIATLGANGTFNFSFQIPLGSTSGLTRMRVRGGDDSQVPVDACNNGSWGEVEDYWINITAPMANDIALTSVNAPVNPIAAGLQNVEINLSNLGTNNLDSAKIGWQINGVAQTTANYIPGAPITIGNSGTAVLGQFNFASGFSTIKAYVNTLNGAADLNASNDTVETTVCTPLSGTYTIGPAGNFTTFTQAVNALSTCGVSGPVVFNVAPNSGPYNERVVINEITGASSVNTITINGNGNTLAFAATSTNERTTLLLDGADFVTVDSLRIEANGTTWGWVLQLTNSANNNTFTKCTMVTGTSSTSTFFNNIAISGSLTSATSSGNNGDNNTFTNNTLIGGYYGISLYGSSTLSPAQGNKFNNNRVEDFAFAGVYFSNQEDIEVKNNDISRATRTSVTTFYGIGFLGTNPGAIIEGNAIHDNSTAITSSTSVAYPFYASSGAGTVAKPVRIQNNIVYNINSNGTQYGVYFLSNSFHIQFYHNTIVLDNTAQTGTSTLAGFYHTGLATGVDVKNNIFQINNGNNGTKYGLWFSNASAAFSSDYNVVNNLSTTGTNIFGRLGTTNRNTLIDWQTNTPHDANSKDDNPFLANASAGNVKPLISTVDNMGTALGVNTDFTGAARSLTTPDAGAFEFTGIGGDIGVSNARLFRQSDCYSASDSVEVTIANLFGPSIDFSVNPLTIVWNVNGPVNTSDSAVLNLGTLATGASMVIKTNGINMSQPGTYTLNGYIKPNASNESAANDTATPFSITVPPILAVSPQTATLTGPLQTQNLIIQSPLAPTPTFFFTEICHFRGSTNGAPIGGWPSYLLADDYVEITGVPGSDLGGITFEMWTTAALSFSTTLPAGTVLSPQGTAIIATGQLNASTPSPSNFYYHLGKTTILGSTTTQGYILKTPSGQIIDAVVYGNFTFPAAAGVTATDWSGITPGMSSAGNRLEGAYTKDPTNWTNSGTGGNNNRQDPNTVNQNVTVPAAPTVPGLTWSHNNTSLGSNLTIAAGPHNQDGQYVYYATYVNACGTFVDSAVITVDLTKASIASQTQASCLTATDAEATAQGAGGNAPYTYLWNDPLAQTTATATGLGVGTYMVIVTDANMHPDTAYATITNGDVTPPTVLTQNINVNLDANGTASITGMDVNNGSSDNCVIASMNVSPNTFGCSDVGANTVTLTVTDDAGNFATGTATVTVIDNTAPTVITQNINAYLDASGSVSITPGMIDNGSSDACGILSRTLDISTFGCAQLGANTVTLTVTDVNSNAANATATVTVLDTIKPTISAINSITLTLDASGNATLAVSDVETGSTDNCGIIQTQVLSKTLFTCADLGNNNVTYTVTDGSGNFSSQNITVNVADNIAPTVITKNFTIFLNSFSQAFVNPSDVNDGSFDNCGIQSIALSKTVFGCSDIGQNTVTLTVTDLSNNVSTGTAIVTINDTNQATIQTKSPTVYLDSLGNVSISFADIDNGTVADCGISSLSVAPNQFNCSNIGPNTVTFTVIDINNNVTTGTPTVTVADTIAPVVTVYPPDTLYASTSNCFALLNWKPFIQVFDACSPSFTITSTQDDFLLIQTGTAVINFTVTDIYGNSRGHSHTVHVIDTVKPVITGVPADVNIVGNANCEATYSWTTPTASDNCVGVTLTASHTPGSTFTGGVTPVIFTATDASGNQTIRSFNITIIDTVKPTAIAQNIDVYLDTNGEATITASMLDNGSSDNCSSISFSVSKENFECGDLGPNTVTFTVLDAGNNSSSTTAIVTVLDTISPRFEPLVSNIVLSTDSGQCGAQVNWSVLGSTPSSQVGFTGAFAPSNWSVNAQGTGSVSFANAPNSLTLNGSDGGTNQNLNVDATVTIPTTGTISFNWSYSTTDGPSFDPFGYLLNGVFTELTNPSGGNNQTGTLSLSLNQGDVFGFRQNSVDDIFGPGVTITSQFTTLGFGVNGALDNCAVDSAYNSLTGVGYPAQFYPVGTTAPFDLTIYDQSGNSKTETFTIQVIDNELPNVLVSNINAYLDANGQVVIGVSDINNGSSDNCGIDTMYLSMTNFDCSHVGTNTVTLFVEDVNGNMANANAVVTVVDTISPELNLTPVTAYLNTLSQASISIGDVSNITDACGVDSTFISQTTFDCSDLGANSILVFASDINGNTTTSTVQVTVVDTILATVVTQNATVYLDATGNASISVSDIDNGSVAGCGTASITVSPNQFGCADVGANTVTLTLTDIANIATSGTATVTVVDTIKPIINALATITLSLDASGMASLAVIDIENGSTDNCNIQTQVLSKTLFDCSDIGSNTVTYTVTDENGNISSQNIQVIVVDNISPTVLTQNITLFLDTQASATITTMDIDNGSSDNCGIQSITLDKTSFGCNDLGLNTVTLTVVDVNNNSSSATATVIVNDTNSAVMSVLSPTVYLDATGNVTISAADIDNGTTTNCGFTSMVVTPNQFTCAEIGANTVTFTVTDVSNNVTSTTTTVTVVDTVAPTVNAFPPDTLYSTASNCGTLVNWRPFVQVSDACGSATVTSAQNDFLLLDKGLNVLSFTVTDDFGNSKNYNHNFFVIDTVRPTITGVPASVLINANANCDASHSWTTPTASDNCSGVLLTATHVPGTVFPIGTTTVTYTATDAEGNVRIASFDVTVQDNTPPTVLTQNLTISLDANGNASIAAADVNNGSSDNCGGVNLVSVMPNSFTCANIGVNTVVLTVSDMNGNTATATAQVTVNDVTPPTAIAQNATVYLNASGIATLTAGMIDNGSNDQCGVISSMSVSPNSFTCNQVGANTVTLTVSDPSGNTSTATATVTVLDTLAPVVTATNTTVALGANGTVNVTATQLAGSVSDNCSVSSINVSPSSFTCADLGANTVTLTAIDASGNTTTTTATLTIIDNTQPMVVTQNVTVQLDSLGSATITTGMINNGSNDNCSGALTYSLSKSTFNCGDIGANTVILSAMDASGNTGTAMATVTVQDITAPVATSFPPSVLYVDNSSCNALINWKPFIGTFDACSPVTISSMQNDNLLLSKGTHVLNFTLTDASNNTRNYSHTIQVLDTISPSITGVPSNIITNADANACGAIVSWTAPTASDNCPGVTMTTTHAPGSLFPLGTTTVTYTATDAVNNTSTASFTITVSDNNGPVISGQPATIMLNASGSATLTLAQVLTSAGITDNCGVLSSTLSKTSFNCSDIGANNVTITATDVNNNISTQVVVVTVVDNMAPTVNTNNLTVYLGSNGQASITTAQANNGSTDNCSIVSLSLSQSGFNCSDLGTNSVVLSATDASNNTGTGTFTVTVLDTIKPNIAGLLPNITASASSATGTCGANISWTPPTVSDNCLGAVLTSSHAPGSFFGLGTTTVTYTATDASNNVRTRSFTVTVTDNTPPVIAGQPATIYLGTNGQATLTLAQVLGSPVSDNCGVQSTTLSKTTFNCSDLGANNVIITALDVNNNSSTQTVVVTVIDTITPVLNNVPANISVNNDASQCGAIVTWPTITATDNCVGTIVTASPASGSFFSVGTHTVSVSGIDPAGNHVGTTFTVTVTDNQAPVATSVPQNVVLGFCNSVVTYVPPTATDNCGPVTIVQTTGLPSGSNFPTGVTTNTFTLTDIHNNVTTVSFTVTIIPQYTNYTAQNYERCNGDAPFDLSQGIANVTFSGSGVLLDGKTFDPQFSGPGNHGITATFTDTMGCTVLAQFFVTVYPNPDKPIIEQVSSTKLRVIQKFDEYKWFHNYIEIPGQNGQELIINKTGIYEVQVRNQFFCFTLGDPFGVGVNIGIEDLEREIKNVKLYPNPSTGRFTLEFPNPDNKEHSITITDMLGKVLLVTSSKDERTQLDLSNFAQGKYMVRLESNGSSTVKSVIIQH